MYLTQGAWGFVVAVLVVVLGSILIPNRMRLSVAALLFIAGAITAQYLIRGIVYDVSPQYGLVELAITLAGGGLGLFLITRTLKPHIRGAKIVAFGLPAATFVIAAGYASLFPGYGHFTRVHLESGDVLSAHSATIGGQAMLWTEPRESQLLREIERRIPVAVEFDIGSGASWRQLLTASSDTALRHAVEREIEAEMRRRVEREIADHSTPAFMRNWPATAPRISPDRLFIVPKG
jgi:hypothetical protein